MPSQRVPKRRPKIKIQFNSSIVNSSHLHHDYFKSFRLGINVTNDYNAILSFCILCRKLIMPRGFKSRQKPKPRKIQKAAPASQTDINCNKKAAKIDLSPTLSSFDIELGRHLKKACKNLRLNCTTLIHGSLDWILSDEVFASNIQKKYLSVRSRVKTLLKFDECQGDFTSHIISEDIFADNDGLIPAMTALDALTRWFSEGRMCWNCHGWENLLKCSGCKKARYCGVECQEADWERHGGYCQSRQEKRWMKLGATSVPNSK